MDELPAHAKAVLRRAHEHDQRHDDEARRRVREGVARAVGVGGIGARPFERTYAAAEGAAPVAQSAPLAGLLGKLTVAGVVVAMVGTGIALRRRGADALELRDTRASAVVMVPPVTGTTSRSSAPMPPAAGPRPGVQNDLPSRPRVAASSHAGRRSRGSELGARVPTPETLDQEVLLLRVLDDAVARRDTHEAHRLLAQHRARFRSPVLLEERQGFSALVACMEHGSGALASSRAFVARYPNSVLTARVLRECEPEGR